MMNSIYKTIALAVSTIFILGACSEKETYVPAFEEGGAVSFRTYVPSAPAATKAVTGYSLVEKPYLFSVRTYKEESGAAVPVGDAVEYLHNTTDEAGVLTVNGAVSPIYWQDNVTPYAFKTTAGTLTLEADQSTEGKFLLQDKITGYAYTEVKSDGTATDDNINDFNYHTNREWYARAKALTPLTSDPDDWKTVPLYIHHDRAWVTIILKAGVNVTRESLAYVADNPDLTETISSWSGSPVEEMKITPLVSEAFVDYDADDNGPAATHVSTTQYDAIVEPYEYKNHPNAVITNINLLGMKYSFSAKHDERWGDAAKDAELTTAYNLEAGQHLTITAVLNNTDHVVLVSAYVEPWIEEVTQTVINDFGMNGDPYLIKTKQDLIDFIENTTRNTKGNVALLQASEIDLDGGGADWDGSAYTLNASLNLAGGKLLTKSTLVNTIALGGSVENGTVEAVKGTGTVDAFIAGTNDGTIDRIKLVTDLEDRAVASQGGLVVSNTGNITNSTSAVSVVPAADYAGGIAATSSGKISNCTVTGKVKGPDSVIAAGGIVGQAQDGAVIHANTFAYGITVSQTPAKYLNIVGATAAGASVNASDNAWPTKADNAAAGSVNIAEKQYDGIIDSEEDLKTSLNPATQISEHGVPKTLNAANMECLLADGFTVSGDTWGYRTSSSISDYDILYTLYGNDKTVTLDGETNADMLFHRIAGGVQDLTLYVLKDIEPAVKTTSTAMASLGYYADNCTISNVKVCTYPYDGAGRPAIKAANPAGVVVWACNNAVIDNCQFYGTVMVDLGGNTLGTGQTYCGGIVSMAARATVNNCVCHLAAPFLREGTDPDYEENVYYGGIVGGTFDSAPSGSEVPSLLITNCTSNMYVDKTSPATAANHLAAIRSHSGAVIGYAVYKMFNNEIVPGMAEGCMGNWWGSNTTATSKTSRDLFSAFGAEDEDIVGRVNAVKPELDDAWKK